MADGLLCVPVPDKEKDRYKGGLGVFWRGGGLQTVVSVFEQQFRV